MLNILKFLGTLLFMFMDSVETFPKRWHATIHEVPCVIFNLQTDLNKMQCKNPEARDIVI